MICAQRKLYAWITMAAMFGGTALFAVIAIKKGPPQGHELWINLWPISTGIGTVVSFNVLRRAYKEEPSSGFWHLSLGDLLTASLTFGALLGIIRNLCDDLEFAQTTFISMILAGVTLLGLLIASRLGLPRKQRPFFGIAFALGTTALLIIGGFFSIALIALIIDKDLTTFVKAWDRGSLRTARWSLIVCLPAAALCYRMSRLAPPRAPHFGRGKAPRNALGQPETPS
jgi:hypothetical protein